ncbi:MAG: PH domain-containing protein [Pirellula sp.]|jgi:membrane protein YdbS with pleckstrin-like domain
MVQEQNDFEQLDPNLIRAERLSSMIFFAVVLFLGLIGWVVFAFFGWGLRDFRTWAALLAGVTLLALLSRWSYKYPFLRWQTTRLRKSELGLELHRGVYWQHKIFIPRERIQHTDITQGPISRKFQIAELVINTAGNHNYVIKIEGLNVERARQLRLELLPRVRSKEEQKRELYNEAISISLESQSQHTGVVSAAKVDDEEPKQDLLVCDAHPSIQGTVSQESVEPIVLDRKEDEIERSR